MNVLKSFPETCSQKSNNGAFFQDDTMRIVEFLCYLIRTPNIPIYSNPIRSSLSHCLGGVTVTTPTFLDASQLSDLTDLTKY